MAEGVVACQGTHVFCLFRVQLFQVETNSAPGTPGKTCSKLPDSFRLEVLYAAVGAAIQQHLENFNQVIGAGKQPGVPAHAAQHGCPHVVYITLYVLVAEIRVFLCGCTAQR